MATKAKAKPKSGAKKNKVVPYPKGFIPQVEALRDITRERWVLTEKFQWRASFFNVEIRDNGALIGFAGIGSTPEEAMENLWKQIVQIHPGIKTKEQKEAPLLVQNAYVWGRRTFYWAGTKWETVETWPK